MSVYEKGFFTILGCSLLFSVIAIPLALRMVPPNIVYGFRTRATLSGRNLWYRANAHFGRGLLVSSLCGGAAAYFLYGVRPLPPETFLPVSLVVLVAPALVAALSTARYIRSSRSQS